MDGFLSQNSLNKDPFFGRFSVNMGGLSRNWRKVAKNGSSSAKSHHSGYESKFRQLEEGAFLRTAGRPPSIRKSCTPPPPPGQIHVKIYLTEFGYFTQDMATAGPF